MLQVFEKQKVVLKVQEEPVVGKGMRGVVVDHPFHPPGTDVVTTAVLSIDGTRVETKHSVYEIVR